MTITHTTDARFEALAQFTEYGPNYNRGVASNLADAKLFAGRGESDSAEHYLLVAEVQAGLITVERFEELDPTGSTWVGVRSGIPAWGGDGTSDTTQRDRVRAAIIASGFAWPLSRIEVRRSAGPGSDLAIALGILVASGVLPATAPRPVGTLGLDGSISDTTYELGARTLRELVTLYGGR